MDGIYCNDCGTELDEAPTLLPDQRPPCPQCGSLGRRFEQDITDRIALSDGGTATDALSVTRTDGSTTNVHAQTATMTITAHDATVRTETQARGFRGPRRLTDRLVVMGRCLDWTPLTSRSAETSRSLWWIQLSEQPTWLVQVVNKAGELIGGGTELENNQIEALAGVAEHLLPSDARPMLLTVTDQAGEVLAVSTTDNPVKTLAAVTDTLLPRHPG
jgi:hypothetical protein